MISIDSNEPQDPNLSNEKLENNNDINNKIEQFKQRIRELEIENRNLKLENKRNKYLDSICNVTFNNIHPELKEDIDYSIMKAIRKFEEKFGDEDNDIKWSGSIKYFSKFCLDTSRQVNTNEILRLYEVPYYSRLFETPLPADENWTNVPRSLHKCFNCDDTKHSIKNCPYPIDRERVKKAKIEHRQKTTVVDPDARYWDTQFIPGILSEKLMNALGIKKDEYPPYFENMVKYGLPPSYNRKKESTTSTKKKSNIGEDYINVDDMAIEETEHIKEYCSKINEYIEISRKKRKYDNLSVDDSRERYSRKHDERGRKEIYFDDYDDQRSSGNYKRYDRYRSRYDGYNYYDDGYSRNEYHLDYSWNPERKRKRR